jgi:hypothetical protein
MVILTILYDSIAAKKGIPRSSNSLYHLFGCGILITPCGHLVPAAHKDADADSLTPMVLITSSTALHGFGPLTLIYPRKDGHTLT